MYINKYLLLNTLILSTLLLSGCSGIKDSLGLEKESPDEFAVITRAPLEIPNHFSTTLPPPRIGASRPQEKATIEQAKEALLGHTQDSTETSSSAEDLLLQRAGINEIDPNIRSTLNKETEELENRNKHIAKRLLNLGRNNSKSSATVVDAKKELKRIQKNKKENKNVTYGETPTLEE